MGTFFWNLRVLWFLLHYQISLIDFLVMQISSVAPGTALSVWWPAALFWNISEMVRRISVKIWRDSSKIQVWANPVRVTLTQRECLFNPIVVQLLSTQCTTIVPRILVKQITSMNMSEILRNNQMVAVFCRCGWLTAIWVTDMSWLIQFLN